MLRVIKSKVESNAMSALQRLRQNVQECFLADWRAFTVATRDDEWIMEHLVNFALGGKLFARRSALDQAYTKVADLICIDREKKDTKELLDEAKLMVGVRAAVTVTFVKMPLCRTNKSKAATLREVKRLIAALELEDFPAPIMNMLDDSAK